MAGHGEKYNRKHEAAALALVWCGRIEQAGAAIDVDESTLRRWMKRDDFRAVCADVRRQVFEAAASETVGGYSAGVKTLIGLLTHKSVRVRLQAAVALTN